MLTGAKVGFVIGFSIVVLNSLYHILTGGDFFEWGVGALLGAPLTGIVLAGFGAITGWVLGYVALLLDALFLPRAEEEEDYEEETPQTTPPN